MKKTLSTLSMLLLMFAAIAQNQISELQKGMVFHAPLSEWYPTKDLVSNTNGNATAVYNISDKQGSGNNRYFSFNGTSDYITLPTLSAFGSADFSITGKIKTGAIGAVRTIIGGAANSFELYISATGYLTAIKYGGSALTASTTLLAANTEYTFAYVRSSTTGTYYVNGTAAGTCTDSNNYSVECTLLGKGTGYFNGYQFMVRAFNYALSSVVNYSKPEYTIEYSDRDGAGILCVLNLAAEGLAKASDGSYNTGYWTDRTNSITATVSGATNVIPPASNLNATMFTGASKISLTGVSPVLGSNPRTLSVWINKQTTGTQTVFSYGANNPNQCVDLAFISEKPSFDINGTSASSTSTVSLNTWYHIAIVYSGGNVSFYINGALDRLTTIAGVNTVAGNFVIGTYVDGTSIPFNGLISNAQVINYAMSADQVKLLYDLGH